MGSVLVTRASVQPSRRLDAPVSAEPEPFAPDAADAAWWAAQSAAAGGEGPAADLTCLSDRAWLLEEGQALARRLRRDDPTGAWRVASHELRAVAGSMKFHAIDTADQYAAHPHTPVRSDYRRVRLPRPGSRRSPLACELDTLAAWYLHLDTAAGDLAAWHLLYAADQADEWAVDNADQYREAEAAWLAALEERCRDLGYSF